MFKKISERLWDNYTLLRVKNLFGVENQGICICFCLFFRKNSAIDESLNSLGFNVVIISGYLAKRDRTKVYGYIFDRISKNIFGGKP